MLEEFLFLYNSNLVQIDIWCWSLKLNETGWKGVDHRYEFDRHVRLWGWVYLEFEGGFGG